MKKLFWVALIMVAIGAPVAAQDCGCEDKPLPEVIATVNGVKITKQDFSPETRSRVEQLQRDVIEARARELDLQIDSLLLEAEAKKRGVSASKLIKDEVIAKVKEPTEADAQAFFEKNKGNTQTVFKDEKNDIIEYLRYERQQELAQKLAQRLRAAAQVRIIAKPTAPPANNADRARVLATVNDKQITMGQIEDSLRPLIFNVQEQVYALRKQDLDLKINDTLLSQEAQKKGVTTRALLDTEVNAKVARVTDADAQAFYDQNKERISGDFAQTKAQIVQYLQERKEREATVAFAGQLRRAATLQTNLTAPESPSFSIATDDQPVKGNPKAVVTIVEFTDFECPSCARQHPVLERLVSEFGDRVRLVVRDFPLSQHANARKAAEAAEAAREQGKYWEYVSVLFRNQSALGVEKLRQYAADLGLDRARFDASLDSGKFAENVQRDVMDGRKLRVNGTPALYVNGRRVADNSYESLKSTIEAVLKAEAAVVR
ncbi:MAG TPA: thioredoxin domain-containing protein, partial [Pyrinomonadaceae bacterium]|nr:thioredoxin domain-containing protein [Pyrinomonadaceae bacterium]